MSQDRVRACRYIFFNGFPHHKKLKMVCSGQDAELSSVGLSDDITEEVELKPVNENADSPEIPEERSSGHCKDMQM